MKKLVISNTKGNRFEWEVMDIVNKEETQSLFQKEYVPKAKDRLYIFPDCTIPRFKMKAFCDKYNIAISKTKDKANVLIGNAFLKDMETEYFTGRNYHYEIFKGPFLNYLRRLPVMIAGELITAIENLESELVLLCMQGYRTLEETGINGIKYKLYDDADVEHGNCTASQVNSLESYTTARHYKSAEARAIFEGFVTTGLYSQEAILKIINQDAPVVDETMYQSLRSMFAGGTEDQQVAMEAMANSNPSESMPYLLLLYKEFGEKELYNHPAKHHVNFKSLTTYLFGSKSAWRVTIDDCVDILRDKNVLSSKNMAVLMAEAREIVKNEGETGHFVITDVVPSEEIQKIIEETDLSEAPIAPPTESITAL